MKIHNLILIIISVLPLCMGGCHANSQFVLSDGREGDMNSVSYNAAETVFSEDNPDTSIESKDDNLQSNETMYIYVHVSGAVNHAGVYELEDGSRLYEAVEKAGGFSLNADENYCNLAEKVVDGNQYYIPTKEEAELLRKNTEDSISNEINANSHYTQDGLLDINIATKEELLQLPGIGDTRANAIIEYRDLGNKFSKKEDIMLVSGIKESIYGKIEAYITVSLSCNN